MTYRFTITDWPGPVEIHPGESILDAVLRVGVPISHGCRSGTCGACKAKLVSGQIELKSHSIYALPDRERTDGLILTCRAYPKSDGEIARLGTDENISHPLCRLETEVREIEDLTDDIRRICLAVIKGGRLAFSAGQFASVTFEDQPPRDYSMANRPNDRLLEYHVRRVDGGASSVHATTTLAIGDRVRIDGPYGACWLREKHAGPILAVAGGSGLAPMKSIIETALAKGLGQSIALYVVAMQERELYMEDHFLSLQERFENFTFTPILAHSSGSTTRRLGAVHDVVLADGYDFDGMKVYSAGPPDIVEALTEMLIARGIRPQDIHAEPFRVAPPETQALETGKQEGTN